MFKRILVAFKFGPASMYALKKSLELARQNDAELHIFHALDYLLQDTDENDPKLVEIREETGHRDIQADLLVLGCHSHKEKMCMGRIDYVGMTILEKAPCPVMLVPLCD